MFLLFKLLKSIKDPRLDKNDWSLIADIYYKLETRDFSAFEVEFLKWQAPNGAIAEFMRHWFGIINELQELKFLMGDALTNYDRLLIVISLLPSDIHLLQMTAQKIEWLSRVCVKHHETNELLRHFLHAISCRIQQHNNQPTTPRQSSLEHDQLQNVVEKIYKEMLIKKLKFLCIEYISSIVENIGLYLKHDKYCILYYSMSGKAIHIPSIIKSEIEGIAFNSSMATITPLLHLLFKKYARLDELIKILNGTINYLENDSMRVVNHAANDERLLVFANTFHDYLKIFKKRIYDSTYTLFSASFTNEPLEDEFIRTCSSITEQILGTSVGLSIGD